MWNTGLYQFFAWGADSEKEFFDIPVTDLQKIPILIDRPDKYGIPHDGISEVCWQEIVVKADIKTGGVSW
jgi:hypothetical protein